MCSQANSCSLFLFIGNILPKRTVVSVTPTTSLHKVFQILQQNAIMSVPVLDENQSFAGMLSQLDILRYVTLEAHRNQSNDQTDESDEQKDLTEENQKLDPSFLLSKCVLDVLSMPYTSWGRYGSRATRFPFLCVQESDPLSKVARILQVPYFFQVCIVAL